MSKKFLHLPIEQKIPLTKKSIQQELEIHEGGYPKHVSMNAEYMLEIFEYVEELQAERHHFEKLSIQFKEENELLKKEIEELSKFKKDAERLFQRQKLGFAVSVEKRERYEKALEFYATCPRSSLHEDGGKMARDVLNNE